MAGETDGNQRRRLAAWRNRAVNRSAELKVVSERIRTMPRLVPESCAAPDDPGWDEIATWLDDAVDVATTPPRLRQALGCFWRGSDIDQAWLAIHRAEVAIAELAPDEMAYVGIITDAREVGEMFLKPKDHRLLALDGADTSLKDKDDEEAARIAHALQGAAAGEGAWQAAPGPDGNGRQLHPAGGERTRALLLTPGSMRRAAAVMRAAYTAGSEKYRQVRDFRNILILSTIVTFLIATALGIAGLVAPEALDACWGEVCASGGTAPHSWDVVLIQLYGLVGAAATGAIAVPRLRGTATPYAVPIWSLVLKLPLGAITAYLGLTLLHVVNGIVIDQIQELAAWAVVFGASQEALTHMIDRQAQNVLDSVPTAAKDTADAGAHARITSLKYAEG